MNLLRVLVIAACSAVMGCSSLSRTTPAGPESAWPRDENGVVLNRIPGTESVDIPAGLSNKQALDAVELAIADTNPEGNNWWVSKWRLELRDAQDRWIRVGLTARAHYLSVCYRVEGNKLIPDVPRSTNLKQDGIRIHRKVPVWINRLNALIQTKAYKLANETKSNGNKTETAK